jgi:DNA modification methylase
LIIHGDCIKELQQFDDDTFDLIVTDPPYGWEFMKGVGIDWDRNIPPVHAWEHCERVLKPGSFMFVFCGPRQDMMYRMMKNIEEGGFKINFTSLYWAFSSGQPKGMHINRALEKREETSISELEGWYAGYQPRPAVEIIIVAMKPLSENNYLEQAKSTHKGCTNLEAAKIPVQDSDNSRFPANLLINDNAIDDGRVYKAPSGTIKRPLGRGAVFNGNTCGFTDRVGEGYGDSGSFSRYFDLDAWFGKKIRDLPEDVQKTFPFLISGKASKKEKESGLEDFPDLPAGAAQFRRDGSLDGKVVISKNPHPAVKPVSILQMLITLGSRKGDLVLDPYMGTGSTGIAASMLSRKFVGIDIDEQYCKIADARISWWENKLRGN